MKSKTKNPFAGVRKAALFGVVCMLLFAIVSCESAKEEPQPSDRVTGTIIGVHLAFMSTFYVQVDDNYPIEKPFYGSMLAPCSSTYRDGFFQT